MEWAKGINKDSNWKMFQYKPSKPTLASECRGASRCAEDVKADAAGEFFPSSAVTKPEMPVLLLLKSSVVPKFGTRSTYISEISASLDEPVQILSLELEISCSNFLDRASSSSMSSLT